MLMVVRGVMAIVMGHVLSNVQIRVLGTAIIRVEILATLHVPVDAKPIAMVNALRATDAAPAVVVTAHVQSDAIATATQVYMQTSDTNF